MSVKKNFGDKSK